MKSIIYLLISLTILTSSLFPQEKDSLIQLYPGFGDTLDHFDRNYFEIFKNIEGFEYAVFYIRNDNQLISKVTYLVQGVTKDTIFIQGLFALDNARLDIEKTEMEKNENIKTLSYVIITTKNGQKLAGKLKIFSKDYLYLIEERNEVEGTVNSRYKIKVTDVDSVFIMGESNALSSMGWGALSGFIAGGLLGFLSGGQSSGFIQMNAAETALSLGVVLGIIGGISGLIVGLVSSSDDEIIEVKSQYDVLKLKDYARYYFRYDDALEKKYVEFEWLLVKIF